MLITLQGAKENRQPPEAQRTKAYHPSRHQHLPSVSQGISPAGHLTLAQCNYVHPPEQQEDQFR